MSDSTNSTKKREIKTINLNRVLLFSGLNYWTGTLDWTDTFLVFVHSMVGFMESC